MRLITMFLCSIALVGCNFDDPLEFDPSDNNNNPPNNISNNPDNSSNGDMGETDTGGGGEIEAEVTNAAVNGDPLPTDVPSQSGLFTVTGDVTATNSPDCDGCNVQLVVALSDGSSMDCLIDEAPTGAAISGEVALEASDDQGTLELLYGAFEASDCAAAMSAAGSLSESLGDINFVEPPPLAVIAVTPADDDIDVVVDTTIRISFNTALDQGSVTGRAQLSGPNGNVQTTVAVMNDEIVLTPQNPLAEFQTVYNVTVTAGITGGGRALESDFTSSFSTRMFVPDEFYAVSNEFHAVGFSLGIDAANQCVMMPADDTAPSQRFRFVPRDGGWIAYNSLAVATGRALDGADGIASCGMVTLGATPMPGQVWTFTNQPSGAFFIQNTQFGAAQSMDSTSNAPGGGGAAPLMQPTTSVARQNWRWRRLQ